MTGSGRGCGPTISERWACTGSPQARTRCGEPPGTSSPETRSACTSRCFCAAGCTAPSSTGRRAQPGRPHELRHLAAGDLPRRCAVRPARPADSEVGARQARRQGVASDRGHDPRRGGAAAAGGAILLRGRERPGRRQHRERRHRTGRARDRPGPPTVCRPRCDTGAPPEVDGGAADSRPGVHRSAAGRSGSEPRGARPRLLHLDPVPASRVRGRGAAGVRLHPVRAARSLPARPARPGLCRPVDLRDRQPLGTAQRAALQPAVPPGVRVLAPRVPAGRSAGGRFRRCGRRRRHGSTAALAARLGQPWASPR